MDTGRRVIDALSLAVNRLDEPAVRDCYRQLIELVDQNLGGELLGGGSVRPLTEPQLVLISYGLKHLRGPEATPFVRAAGRLESALSGTLETQTNTTDSAPEPEHQAAESAAAKPSSEPPPVAAPPATNVSRIKQKIGIVKGGNVTMIGQQITVGAQPAPASQEDDAEDTRDIVPVRGDPPPTVADVFISYSRRNADLMRRIRADLRAAGMSVWTDENLTPGKPSWQRAVHSAIRGARTMIVIMTPDSKESEWVEHEMSDARAVNVPIFPILARGNQKNAIPFALNTYQYVDIRKEGDYRQAMVKLVSALRTEIKRRN